MPTLPVLQSLVECSARRSPEHIAVLDGDRALTYRELDERANQVAHLLRAQGVVRGDRVGLYLNKSLEAIIGLYGVLKAGATYIPLDPRAPAARIAYITADCEIRVLLSGLEKADSWTGLVENGSTATTFVALNGDTEPTGTFDVLGATELAGLPTDPPRSDVIDLDLAYILYTSGSTGRPKGVKLSHLNALSFVKWAGDTFRVGPHDKVSSHAPLHFDLSVFDVFAAHRAGATLVLVPQKVSTFPIEAVRFIETNQISVWYSVPSILSMIVERGGLEVGDLPSLRTILFAGEVFPTKYLRSLMELLPHVRFANLYGPTETNVCTWYEVPEPPEGDDPIPIGRQIDNVDVFAVTDDGRRAKPGEVGELLVRGTTVMNGYWGDPERSARTLRKHPFDPEAVDRVYATGDLVRENENGDFEFLGRRDAQIKSRGYRIELGDIETALNAHPDVVECAVVPVPDDLVTNRIHAVVATKSDMQARELSRFCGERVPQYMVPESFDFRDELPKTSTGKIDRRSLLDEAAARNGHVEAGTAPER